MLKTYLKHKNQAGIFLILCLISCSPKSTINKLPIESPKQFSYEGTAPLNDFWWTSFNDEELNGLIDEALDSNFNILAAWQRFKVAEKVVDREQGFLLPDVGLNASSGLSRPEPDFVGGENVQIGIRATYEVDLWGRIRSRIEAERYRAESNLYDFQAVALTITAEITRTWYQLQTSHNLLALVNEQIETNRNILRLIRARFGLGQIRGVDILRQEQLLEASKQQKVQLTADIKVLENQLAVLIGEVPQEEILYNTDSLPDLPPLPVTGLPSELINRRPDVQRDFSLLQAADRELASAITAQYPRISLSTAFSFRSNTVSNLFQEWAYNLAGGLVAPIFYGGRLSAEVERTEAVKKQRLYEYGQTVLTAFQEVENALIQETRQKEILENLEEQVRLSNLAYEQLQIEYFNGFSDYLAVLTALNQVQALQRNLINERMNLIEFRINLYRALAGGFDTNLEEQTQS